MLPDILNKVGPVPAMHPHDFDAIRPGKIYVAKPDFHMIVEDSHIRMTKGPKETRTRPAINPLFRTAAQAYGRRVIGVILTGLLDDGAAGLAEVKRRGGITVVQNPETALFPDMPSSALEHVTVDHVAEPKDLGQLLDSLTRKVAGKGLSSN
jgi:two-component system chemotaxis response regulator CheB